jgi:hypothetical protein
MERFGLVRRYGAIMQILMCVFFLHRSNQQSTLRKSDLDIPSMTIVCGATGRDCASPLQRRGKSNWVTGKVVVVHEDDLEVWYALSGQKITPVPVR